MKEQRCHYCYKYYPVTWYRLITINGQTLRGNICFECERKGYKLDTKKHDKPINTFKETPYLVAFIGNTPYKEICDIYKIRYEE